MPPAVIVSTIAEHEHNSYQEGSRHGEDLLSSYPSTYYYSDYYSDHYSDYYGSAQEREEVAQVHLAHAEHRLP
jgi:hypothetical protein